MSLPKLQLGLLLAATLALGGCKKDSAGSGAPPKDVRLGYFANLTHAQAVLGVSSGDFAKALGSVKFTPRPPFNAGPSLIEALTAGDIDIGYIGPQPALSAYLRNSNVVVIAGAAANGSLIVARKDSGITKLQDLAGRRIATPQLGNTQDLSARAYLINVLKQSRADVDKNVIPVPNADQVAMMQRGQIDAAWVPEPWGARLIVEAGATLIAEEKDLWPEHELTVTVVITTPKFLKEHPDVVKKFLAVHHEWTLRLQKEPETVLPQLGEALYKLTGKRLPEGVLPQAFSRTKFTDEPRADTFKTYSQWSYDLGFSKSLGDLGNLIDTRILKEVQSAPPTTAKGPSPANGTH